MRKKHCLTNKHKYFLNLILNKYTVRNLEIDKFKGIIQSYYDKHKRKFDEFTVGVMWMEMGVVTKKISVPSMITLRKPHSFEPNMIELAIVLKMPAYDFLHKFDGSCINDEVVEIKIICISDLKYKTFSHYMAQAKLTKMFQKN